jgi:hypothetical protein
MSSVVEMSIIYQELGFDPDLKTYHVTKTVSAPKKKKHQDWTNIKALMLLSLAHTDSLEHSFNMLYFYIGF